MSKVMTSGITDDGTRSRPVISTYSRTATSPTHVVLTNLAQDAIATAVGSRVTCFDMYCGEDYVLAVATPTSVEIYRAGISNVPGGPTSLTWTHDTSYSFPDGVFGPISIVVGDFASYTVAVTARQTPAGLSRGVIIQGPAMGAGTVMWITGGTGNTRLLAATPCGDWLNFAICAVGRTQDTGGAFDAFAVKVDATGAPLTAFDGDGKKRFTYGASGKPNNHARSLWIDTSGRWWILANTCDSTNQVCAPAVARLTATGGFDTTFSGDGRATFSAGGYSSTTVNTLVHWGSRTYFAGQVFTDSTFSTSNSFLFAITDSGVGDTSFGTNGLRTFNNYTGAGLEGYSGLTVTSDGTTNRLFATGDRDVTGGTVAGVLARHAL